MNLDQPYINIIITREGVEKVKIVSSTPKQQRDGLRLCEVLTKAIAKLDKLVKSAQGGKKD